MARFGNVAELATFLGKLDADYAEYAPALWQNVYQDSAAACKLQ